MATIGAIIAVYAVPYLMFFLPYVWRNRLSYWQYDKALHAAMGYLIAAGLASFLGVRHLRWFLVIVAATSIGWEILELFVDPWMMTLHSPASAFHLGDMLGDIASGGAGAVLYWILARGR